ncbi:MAG: four helix bundle protein [Rhodospirillales bacterium]|nr:four helix bundle protein [Rhodospirillales bacterium]
MVSSVYELDVYKRAYPTALDVHKSTLTFPKIEQYALADQLRRAAKSICANLAEGFAKSHQFPAEFKRFINMAIGSAEEVCVWLDFAHDLEYIGSAEHEMWKNHYGVICRQLHKLSKNWKS